MISIKNQAYLCATLALTFATSMGVDDAAPVADFPKDYEGAPFSDESDTAGAQELPGKLRCAYYDLGGEGVAYHDLGKNNEGSNGLKKGGKNEVDKFRRGDGVDLSYTKDFADKWQGQKFFPEMGMLYVGWTDAGEWLNYTVDVTVAGTFTFDIVHTSKMGGVLSLHVNGEAPDENIDIDSTYDPKDGTAWRQWHHWNLVKGAGEVTLSKGRNLLTLHVVEKGSMNLGDLDFRKK